MSLRLSGRGDKLNIGAGTVCTMIELEKTLQAVAQLICGCYLKAFGAENTDRRTMFHWCID